MALSRVNIVFKYLRQVGLTQAALFALYKFGLITGHYRRLTDARRTKTAIRDLSSTVRGLFDLPDRARLAQTLGDEGQRALLTEADEIVSGKFRMFGGEPVEIKLTFNEPLRHWTEYETGKVPIPDSRFPSPNLPTFDIKLIWEPARFGWAYVLGRAYHLTQNEVYAEAFWRYFETFTQGNPPNLGPHWMNGQEVAIRLMALVWAGQVFGTPPSGGGEGAASSSTETPPQMGRKRRVRLAQSVAEHAARIPPTLVYARAQNNNHLVTEAAALYTAGLALGHAGWRALGWRWLNWAYQHQISSYGEYIQHSVNYHRVMLQAALWVDAIRDVEWPALTSQSLGRATHWLFSMLDPASGRTPNLGANDGALILPLSVTPFHDYRPTVQAAARAFLRFQLPGGVWDEMSLWLGLEAHEKVYDSSLYLADRLRGRESWAYLRTSTFRSRLGHMDQLHLDLWWRGLNLARDAGTYLYNADPPWDNPLVSSRVHNTVTVDGRDQMTRGGRFMTLDWFPAYVSTEIPTDENILQQVKAYHRGYREPDIRHERTVFVYRGERWLVKDQFLYEPLREQESAHRFRIHWLLPDWQWEIRETPVDEIDAIGYDLRLLSPHGWVKVRLWLDYFFAANEPFEFKAGLARAGERLWGEADVLPLDGWVSPTYGVRQPALSFSMTAVTNLAGGFITEFTFPNEN